MPGPHILWKGVWSLMLLNQPDEPEPEEQDDPHPECVPPRDLASPVGRHGRDRDNRGPGRRR
jgi:hypothetical protein